MPCRELWRDAIDHVQVGGWFRRRPDYRGPALYCAIALRATLAATIGARTMSVPPRVKWKTRNSFSTASRTGGARKVLSKIAASPLSTAPERSPHLPSPQQHAYSFMSHLHPASSPPSHLRTIPQRHIDAKSTNTSKQCRRPQKGRREARRPAPLPAGPRETTRMQTVAAPRLHRSPPRRRPAAQPAALSLHRALCSTSPRLRRAAVAMHLPMAMCRPL